MNVLLDKLSFINSAEMEPYYIQWYGFYEGHTFWRTDPLASAFIFGLKSIEEMERAFPGRLYQVLTTEFTEKRKAIHPARVCKHPERRRPPTRCRRCRGSRDERTYIVHPAIGSARIPSGSR